MSSRSQETGDAAQLLGLPDELILLIFDHLDPDGLLCLAMLCRRLHYIALPLYFTRHGMDDPAQNAKFNILDSRRDPLSALQIALFIPAVAELFCFFPHDEKSIHHIFPHIRRLRVLFTRLTSVRKVTLVLDAPSSAPGDSSDGVEAWALEFGELLNMILKRGCTSLTVRYGMFFTQAYELRHSRLVDRPVNAFRSAVRHLLPESPSLMPSAGSDFVQTGVDGMELGPEECSSSALTHFKIESSMLLFPPCFSWSLSALRHSPITCLEFRGITLPTKIWSAVLPRMAVLVPALSELTLSNLHGISGMDILLFVAKLIRLKILTIGYTEYSRHIQSSFPDSGPIPKFHELTSLHAPSTFISHMLKKKSLPNLASLCITPRRLILGFRGMRHIGRSVSDIVHRLEKYKLAPTLSLEIHRGQDSDAEMAADLALVPGGALMKSLEAITRLIVYSDSDMTAPELETLARWIARFPALVHVSLRVRGPKLDAGWASIENARKFSEQNPNVKSFELNGKVFDAENTLKRERRFLPCRAFLTRDHLQAATREIPPFIGV